jgi:phosphatidate cytidylyltransferase
MEASLASDQAGPGSQGDLTTRVFSAAVLGPVALAAVLWGGLPLALLVALVAVIAFWEWTAIGNAFEPAWARIAALACLALGLLGLAILRSDWIILTAGAAVLAVLGGLRWPSLRWMGLGLAYVAIPCAGFLLLRQPEPFGLYAILFLVVVVWATDIAAYFGGRAMGGPKLWPRVSPKKTWSGALTGLVAAIAAGGITVGMTKAGDYRAGLLLAAPLSIAAQAGDLFESAIKRKFGVKDSGSIIPGHGGVLDRVDGLFGAAALAWLLALAGFGGGILLLPGSVVRVAGSVS